MNAGQVNENQEQHEANHRRWQRIDQLTALEEAELRRLTESTPGMSNYGNRARVSVMLPLPIAKQIAFLSKQQNLSVGQVLVDMLQKYSGIQ